MSWQKASEAPAATVVGPPPPPVTGATATTSVPGGAATPTGGGGVPTTVAAGASDAFCQDIEQLQTLLPTLLQTAGETAALTQLQALLARSEADAPAAIRPAVTVVRQTEDQLIKDLTANPPDLADIGRTYRNQAYQQALQQLGVYLLNQC